jgi:outer membrane protein assembly factor BamB
VDFLESQLGGREVFPDDWQFQADGVAIVGGRKVLFAPSNSGQVLCLDTDNESVALVGETLSGAWKYEAGGVLGSDGQAYFAPCKAGRVLRVDPEKDSANLMGQMLRGDWASLATEFCAAIEIFGNTQPRRLVMYKAGGVLGKNGRIYFAPCDVGQVLCVDP